MEPSKAVLSVDLRLYHADIIVLQGLHPLHGPVGWPKSSKTSRPPLVEVGVGVAFGLKEEGYKYALLTEGEEAGIERLHMRVDQFIATKEKKNRFYIILGNAMKKRLTGA